MCVFNAEICVCESFLFPQLLHVHYMPFSKAATLNTKMMMLHAFIYEITSYPFKCRVVMLSPFFAVQAFVVLLVFIKGR